MVVYGVDEVLVLELVNVGACALVVEQLVVPLGDQLVGYVEVLEQLVEWLQHARVKEVNLCAIYNNNNNSKI